MRGLMELLSSDWISPCPSSAGSHWPSQGDTGLLLSQGKNQGFLTPHRQDVLWHQARCCSNIQVQVGGCPPSFCYLSRIFLGMVTGMSDYTPRGTCLSACWSLLPSSPFPISLQDTTGWWL